MRCYFVTYQDLSWRTTAVNGSWVNRNLSKMQTACDNKYVLPRRSCIQCSIWHLCANFTCSIVCKNAGFKGFLFRHLCYALANWIYKGSEWQAFEMLKRCLKSQLWCTRPYKLEHTSNPQCKLLCTGTCTSWFTEFIINYKTLWSSAFMRWDQG